MIEPEFCVICGQSTKFRFQGNIITPQLKKAWGISDQLVEAFNRKESMFCGQCGSSLRIRRLGAVLVQTFFEISKKFYQSVVELCRDEEFRRLKIAEINQCGALHHYLKDHPHLYYSEYMPHVKPGETWQGVQCQDLQALTYPDNYFDIILTSETLEHVSDLNKAWQEIYRTLKPGGYHIFTVPVIPSQSTTVTRAKLVIGEIKHLLEPAYHGQWGQEGMFVYTDFGLDIIETLIKIGLETESFYLNSKEELDVAVVFRSQKLQRINLTNEKRGEQGEMNFTGERYLPVLGDMIGYEHWHRYLFASQFVRDKVVLDIACGEGYGSYFLAQFARQVVGVDIAPEAIQHASSRYLRPNLTFKEGSVSQIPIGDEISFDVIVSFETIEHVDTEAQSRFLSEVKRLLKADGIFIISTPNRLTYSDLPKYQNEFHIKEFYYQEFIEFLKRYFKNVSHLGQRASLASYISDPFKTQGQYIEYRVSQTSQGLWPVDEPKSNTYIIAICSEERLDKLDASFLIDNPAAPVLPYIQLFIDTGFGFTEEESIRETLNLYGQKLKVLEFDVSQYQTIKQLRFDPLDNQVILKLHQIEIVTATAELPNQVVCFSHNALYQQDNLLIFEVHDPSIYLNLENIAQPQRVRVKLEYLAWGADIYPYILRVKTNHLQQQEMALQQQAERIQQQEAALQQQVVTLQQQAERIQQQEAALQQQVVTLRQQAELIQQQEAALQQQADRIQQQEQALQQQVERNSHIADLQIQAQTARAQIRAMQSTRGWRALQEWWRLKARLLPEGSKRIRVFYLARTATGILVYGGLKDLINRIWRWLRGERHYYQPPVRAKSINYQVTEGSNQFQALVDVENEETQLKPAYNPSRISENLADEYEREIRLNLSGSKVKLIAFYLPQFHPIPENDQWWGKGFTEWTNVAKARPLFEDHYQPHLPGELGFYDLRLIEVMKRQIELAKQYGLYGFCFYHYWFAGKRLLERPVNQFLDHPELDFPFCLCWANENWTRRWDGLDQEILIAQEHSPEDDVAFIHDLEKYIRDPRYIKVDDRPLIIIYNARILPEAKASVNRWREYCRECGVGEIFLVMAQTFGSRNPHDFGFDAAVEFPPHAGLNVTDITNEFEFFGGDFAGKVYDYAAIPPNNPMLPQDYPLFKGIIAGWDNTPRRGKRGFVFANNSPQLYQNWLEKMLDFTATNNPPSHQYVFINAWNEWAEGTYLEPDACLGYAYLNATARAIKKYSCDFAYVSGQGELVSVIVPAYNHENYIDEALNSIKQQTYKNLEIIIVNDGSTDATRQKAEIFVSENPELNLRIINQANAGAHAAIMRGIQESAGKYIALLNSDDIFHPDRIQILYQSLKQNREKLAYSDILMIDEKSAPVSDEANPYARSLKEHLQNISTYPSIGYALFTFNNAISTGNLFFEKTLYDQVGGFNDLRYCHDWDFVLSALEFTTPVRIPQKLYYYRLHQTNTIFQLGRDTPSMEAEVVLKKAATRVLQTQNPEAYPSLTRSKAYFRQLIRSIGHEQILSSLSDGSHLPKLRGKEINGSNGQGRKDIYETFHHLSDDEWLAVLIHSITTPAIGGSDFPQFPDEELQRGMVGSSNEASLQEAFLFYQEIKRYAYTQNLNIEEGSHLLDFGCGWGRHYRFFLKDLPPQNILGIDSDSQFIELCKTLAPAGNFKHIKPFPPTDLAANSFDIVYAYSVFSHLNEQIGLAWIEEFARLLKPGGLVIVTTREKSFLEWCDALRRHPETQTNSFYQLLAQKAFVDLPGAYERYGRGEFLYAATGGGPSRPPEIYGEAVLSKKYVQRMWTTHFDLVDFVDDPSRLPQALIVLRKKEEKQAETDKNIYETFHHLSDDEWLQVLIRSVNNPTIRGGDLPRFPDEAQQRSMVGSSNEWALREAFLFYQEIKRYVHAQHLSIDEGAHLLDFGCGWGRHYRFFLKDLPPQNILGIDSVREFIDLCQTTIPMGNFKPIEPFPPTGLAANAFDIVYAYSVFSHLNEQIGLAWIEEFARLLKPDGLLIVTTHAKSFFELCESLRREPEKQTNPWYQALAQKAFLNLEEAYEGYDRGDFLYAATGGGPNLPADIYGEAVLSEEYVKKMWTKHFDLVDFVDAPSRLPQALIVLRKKRISQ